MGARADGNRHRVRPGHGRGVDRPGHRPSPVPRLPGSPDLLPRPLAPVPTAHRYRPCSRRGPGARRRADVARARSRRRGPTHLDSAGQRSLGEGPPPGGGGVDGPTAYRGGASTQIHRATSRQPERRRTGRRVGPLRERATAPARAPTAPGQRARGAHPGTAFPGRRDHHRCPGGHRTPRFRRSPPRRGCAPAAVSVDSPGHGGWPLDACRPRDALAHARGIGAPRPLRAAPRPGADRGGASLLDPRHSGSASPRPVDAAGGCRRPGQSRAHGCQRDHPPDPPTLHRAAPGSGGYRRAALGQRVLHPTRAVEPAPIDPSPGYGDRVVADPGRRRGALRSPTSAASNACGGCSRCGAMGVHRRKRCLGLQSVRPGLR